MYLIPIRKLNNPEMEETLYKFKRNVTWKTMNDVSHCSDVLKSVYAGIEKGKELYKELFDKYTQKNEDGTPILEENGFPKITDPVEFKKKFEELLDVEIEIKGKLWMDKIQDSKLSANDFDILSFLF